MSFVIAEMMQPSDVIHPFPLLLLLLLLLCHIGTFSRACVPSTKPWAESFVTGGIMELCFWRTSALGRSRICAT
jgi:hypothetical protein